VKLKAFKNEVIYAKEKTMLDDYLTDEDVMEKFKVSKHTLRSYRGQGKLPYCKFMGKIVYKVVDIKEFLERNSVRKTA
jgi:predicted site-specific integrase-resolvase